MELSIFYEISIMKIKLLIVLIILFCSCSRKGTIESRKSEIPMVIDLLSEPESEITRLSDISTNVQYFPLQTTKNSLIGSIDKVVKWGNRIYIKNSYSEILCFDEKGNFIFKLNKTGSGPGEYKYIADFDISSDNKTLIVLSNGKILIFNINDNEFKFEKSINLKSPFPSKIDFLPETNNILISIDPMTGLEISLTLLIDFNGDTILLKPNYYRFEKKDKLIRGMANESLHYKFGKVLCFKEEFCDTVYFVDKELNSFLPRLIIDSNGKGISPIVRYDSEYARNHGNQIYWVKSVMEMPRFVFYTYEHNMSRYKVLYDKSNKRKFKMAYIDALKDDIIGGPSLDISFCSEDKAYCFVDVLKLKKYTNSNDFLNAKVKDNHKKQDLKTISELLNETDNPILVVITLKK